MKANKPFFVDNITQMWKIFSCCWKLSAFFFWHAYWSQLKWKLITVTSFNYHLHYHHPHWLRQQVWRLTFNLWPLSTHIGIQDSWRYTAQFLIHKATMFVSIDCYSFTLTPCNILMECSIASCSGVSSLSPADGSMNTDMSAWTGTDTAFCRTRKNFWRSDETNRSRMCLNRSGKILTRAVRKAWDGRLAVRSRGGFVLAIPMPYQTRHALDHSTSLSIRSATSLSRSVESDTEVLSLVSFSGAATTFSDRLMASSAGMMRSSERAVSSVCFSLLLLALLTCLTRLSFLGGLSCSTSWKLFRAFRETSLLGLRAEDSMCCSNSAQALGKSPLKRKSRKSHF